MKYILACTVVLTFLTDGSSFAQGQILDGPEKKAVLQELEGIQRALDPTHYQAEMRFKEFGGDTFEVRNFSINYRSNPNNPLYGYDYEIAEMRQSGDTFIIMALNKSFYRIITGKKMIIEDELPDDINLGSYFEYIRTSFIIRDGFEPFLNASSDEVSVADSNGNYYLQRRMNELAVRHLVIDKETRLPVMWSGVIQSPDFDLTQTTEIHLHFGKKTNTLPVTAFSLDEYLAKGYEFIVSVRDSPDKPPVERTLSPDQQNMILNFPFLLPDGDTVVIRNSPADYILLDFWYASCLPCLMAMPEVNALAKEYADAGLQVFGINCFDMGIKENLSVKMKDKNIQIPLLFGARDLIRSLGISSFPTYCLITPDREIEYINDGVEGVRHTMESIFDRN